MGNSHLWGLFAISDTHSSSPIMSPDFILMLICILLSLIRVNSASPFPEPNAESSESENDLQSTAGTPDGGTVNDGHFEVVLPKADCVSCSMQDWISFGDSDPHVSVKLLRSTLTRPVCYDLKGVSGDVFKLFSIEATTQTPQIDVHGVLIQSPRNHRHHQTYFGKFILSTAGLALEVRPDNITVVEAGQPKRFPWLRMVPHGHSLVYKKSNLNISVVHWKRKIMKIDTPGGQFYIKKNLLKYKHNSTTPKESFHYLGIYLKQNNASAYGGLIGELLHQTADLTTMFGSPAITFKSPHDVDRTVNVVDHREKDWMNEERFACWLIPDIQKILRQPLRYYKRHVNTFSLRAILDRVTDRKTLA